MSDRIDRIPSFKLRDELRQAQARVAAVEADRDRLQNERDSLRSELIALREELDQAPADHVLVERDEARAQLAAANDAIQRVRTISTSKFGVRPAQIGLNGQDVLDALAASRPSSPDTTEATESRGPHDHRWKCETCEARRSDPVPIPAELLALSASSPDTENSDKET